MIAEIAVPFGLGLILWLGYALGLTKGRYEQEVKRREDIELFAGLRRAKPSSVRPAPPEPEEIAVARAEADQAEREKLDTEIVDRMTDDFVKHQGLTREVAQREAHRILKQGMGDLA